MAQGRGLTQGDDSSVGMTIQMSNNSGMGGDASRACVCDGWGYRTGEVGGDASRAYCMGRRGVVGLCPTLCSAEERAVHACDIIGPLKAVE